MTIELAKSDVGTKNMEDLNQITDDGSERRSRLMKTVAVFSTFLTMGLSSSLLGTTLVHLEKLFDSNAQMVSISVVVSGVGYLIGAVLCAFVYDRANPEVLFAAFNLMGVASSVVAAYSQNFIVFIAAMVAHELSFGFDDAAGQSYCVGLWDGHRLQKPLLQGMHAIWSLAGIFGPMVVKLFLCELETVESSNNSTSPLVNESWATEEGIDNSKTINLGGCLSSEESIATTRFAFLTFGIIAFITNLPFLVLAIKSFIGRSTSRNEHILQQETKAAQELLKISPQNAEGQRPEVKLRKKGIKSSTFTVVHMIFIFIFTMLNLYSEFLPILFLVSFALKYLEWTVMKSSLLLSVYFVAHFAGRIAGIFNSLWLSPAKMLCFNLVLTATAHLSMLLVNVWPAVAWIGAALAGFGVSTTFPANVLWISETTPMTGRIGAVMIVGSCCATIPSPYIAATLTSTLSQMWFVYILLMASSSHILVFVLEAVFIRRYS